MKNKEIFSLHAAVMLFGLSGVIGKFVGLPAIFITFARAFFSAVFLLIVMLIKKENILNCFLFLYLFLIFKKTTQ